MSRRGLLLGAAALGGCGFTPAYGPGGPGNLLRGRIEAAAPQSTMDFAFVEQFETRLGRAAGAPFELRYAIETNEDPLAFTGDREIQRYQLEGVVLWSVIDRDSGAEVTQGTITSFAPYSAVGSTVSTRASQTDAEQRLAVILADRVVTGLVGTAGAWAS